MISIGGMVTLLLPAASIRAEPSPLDALGQLTPYVVSGGLAGFYFFRWARRHKRQALIIVALLVVASIFFGSAYTQRPGMVQAPIEVRTESALTSEAPQKGTTFTVQPSTLDFPVGPPSTPPSMNTILVAIVQAAVILSLLGYLFLLPRLRAAGRKRPEESLRRTVPRFPSALLLKGEFSKAVVEAYVAARHWAEGRGLLLRESETPGSVAKRVCSNIPHACEAFRALTGLYEEARYSPHEIEKDKSERASACFQMIADSPR